MGHVRDQAMFEQMDAHDHGYRDGHDQAQTVAHLTIADSLGITTELVANLTAQNLGSKILALQAVKASIASRIEATAKKIETYTDRDPIVVSWGFIEDQKAEDDQRGYTRGSDYIFTLNLDEIVEVQTSYMMGQYFDRYELTADWIKGRLATLGVEQDEEFCAEVVTSVTGLLIAQGTEA